MFSYDALYTGFQKPKEKKPNNNKKQTNKHNNKKQTNKTKQNQKN